MLLLPLLLQCLAALPAAAAPRETGTLSIVAAEAATGEIGVGTASGSLAVGSLVPYARAGVGALATQALAAPSWGERALGLLEAGASPEQVLDYLLRQDAESPRRQVALVDAEGMGVAHTGDSCPAWAGQRTGPHCVVLGSHLVGPAVLTAMAEAFETAEGPLAERLLAALEAGRAQGGDLRGLRSAALLVARERGGPGGKNDRLVDLRVDHHAAPVRELRRIYELLEPERVDVRRRLALELRERGDVARSARELALAERALSEALQREPEDPDRLVAMAVFVLEERGRFEEALELASRATVLEETHARAWATLARAHHLLGHRDEAVYCIDKALELDPEQASWRAARERYGSPEGARRR